MTFSWSSLTVYLVIFAPALVALIAVAERDLRDERRSRLAFLARQVRKSRR